MIIINIIIITIIIINIIIITIFITIIIINDRDREIVLNTSENEQGDYLYNFSVWCEKWPQPLLFAPLKGHTKDLMGKTPDAVGSNILYEYGKTRTQ